MNLTAAIHREERRIKNQIDALQERLTVLRRASAALNGMGAPQRGKRRRLSAAARRRISMAQKARWAKQRKAAE
jgi:hypothetical protein